LTNNRLAILDHFIPTRSPTLLAPLLALIELVSYLARALSLGVRLFSNMLARHTLLAIRASALHSFIGASVFMALCALVPYRLFLLLIILEIGVSFIQSFVFIVLVATYLNDSEKVHIV